MSNEPTAFRSAISEAPPAGVLWHPYVQVALSVLLSAVAQVALKLGSSAGDASTLAVGALRSGWVWVGIAAMIVSLLSWLYALRFVALAPAFTLTGAVHALVPLGSWMFLGEVISAQRWMGILLVIAGVVISAKPAALAEEKL
jgi:drug/metabolite transporter (DMT)-like permease